MYIGDLHIHSRYSRATSRDCTPEYLELWARKKGIDLVGTGDFTHPAWREELKEKLAPAEEGLYVLKDEYRIRDGAPDDRRPRFVVTGEISSIYKKKERVRKVHSLLLLPSLEDADILSRRLELIGNIHSDGRPILGLDCRDLLEIMLETNERSVYVPAHIWTPHFSLFGAFSGFDRIEDCYEDLTPHIRALETGLSSDPSMNWQVSALDSCFLISNSDAHSPAKLGREANLFDIALSYEGLARAVNWGEGLLGTLEFFPEEGKYHFDGHRKCGLCVDPAKAGSYDNRCPVCGKKLTTGVLHRVEELSDRLPGVRPERGRPYESLVPLPEVIAASTGSSPTGKKVLERYEKMLGSLGAEFDILRRVPAEDIRKAAGPLIAEGICRLREGKVERTPGFDGEYGTIRLLSPSDISALEGQLSLFTKEELAMQERERRKEPEGPRETKRKAAPAERKEEERKGEEGEELQRKEENADGKAKSGQAGLPADVPNLRQQEAVQAADRAIAVIAGPGTGKTKTLLSHLTQLLHTRGTDPSLITAVTFTNRAADEMKSRLLKMPGGRKALRRMRLGTFHSICSRLLTENGIPFYIAEEGLRREFAQKTVERYGLKLSADRFLRELSFMKNTAPQEGTDGERISQEAVRYYQELLGEAGALDYDDLLLHALRLCDEEAYGTDGFSFLLVDEFQDINPLQYRLIRAWNRQGKELFVIGDPDQSIYGFRGSDAACFQRLKEDWTELRTIRLTDNYRSTPEIVDGALSLIGHNGGEKREMEAVRGSGRPIRTVTAADERSEAIFVAKEINRLIGGIDMLDMEGKENLPERSIRSFSDIAVLYRTHRQAALLEYCLRQEGIPYVVAGREDFLLDEGVRGALCFFRSALNPKDGPAEKMALRLLFSSGEKAEERLSSLREEYEKDVRKEKPVKLLERWAVKWKLTEAEPMRRLLDMSVLYGSMEEFLHTLSFGEDGDIRRSGGRKFLSDAVTLMTLHGAKGLEFPAVLLYGVRKGMLPLESSGRPTDREEERRLFYVGMTRAREELILVTSGEESGFLKELPEKALLRETAGKETVKAVQMSLSDFLI